MICGLMDDRILDDPQIPQPNLYLTMEWPYRTKSKHHKKSTNELISLDIVQMCSDSFGYWANPLKKLKHKGMKDVTKRDSKYKLIQNKNRSG